MSKEKQIKKEKEKIISDICPFYKEYGTCEQCNADLDIDGEPCYFECMANAIINNGYRKQSKGEWAYSGSCECLLGTDAPLSYKCSCCGELATDPFGFCPNCGAKMKGGDTE